MTEKHNHERLIGDILSKLMLVQKRFGLNAQDLPEMRVIYAKILESYAPQEVRRAFFDYISEYPDIPAPADLVKIIKGKAPSEIDFNFNEWQTSLAAIYTPQVVAAWFLKCEWDGKVLKCPTRFIQEYIVNNYRDRVDQVLGDCEIVY